MPEPLVLSKLDPQRQAGKILHSASQGPRKAVHTVLDVGMVDDATLEAIQFTGSDIVSVRVAADGAQAAMDAVDRAVGKMAAGVRFDGVPDVAVIDGCVHRGATYLAGSPLRTIAVDPTADVGAILECYRRIDAIAAEAGVVREIAAPAVVAPPATLLTYLLADMVLAASAQVPALALSYPVMGNIVQDAAALAVLRDLAAEVLADLGYGTRLFTSVSHWVGRPDVTPTNRFAIASAASVVAGLCGVDQVVLGSLGGMMAVSDGSLADSVSTTRQMLDMLVDQGIEPSAQLAGERSVLDAEVRANLARITGGSGTLGREAVEKAIGEGLFRADAHAAWAVRDPIGAVRSAKEGDAGAWPVWTGRPTPPSEPPRNNV